MGRENYPIVGETRHHPDRKENKAWRAFLLEKQQQQRQLLVDDDGNGGRDGGVSSSFHSLRLCLHCHRIEIKSTTPSTTSTTCDSILKDGLNVTCPLPFDMQFILNHTDWVDNVHHALPELFHVQQYNNVS